MLPTPTVARHAERPAGRRTAATRCCSVPPRRWACSGHGCAAPARERLVALTHGHEAGWAGMPGGSPLLRRIGDGVDVVTYLGALHPAPDRTGAVAGGRRADGPARTRASTPRRSRRTVDGARSGTRYGLRDRPVVVCVSRLMPRKGQDTLVQALPAIRSRVPGAALLLVGGGPYRDRIERLVDRTGVTDHVVLTGAGRRRRAAGALRGRGRVRDAVPHPQPRASTSRGWASSTWRRRPPGCRSWPATPAGRRTRSWPGETGYVVPGRDVAEVADRVSELLLDPDRAAADGGARPGVGRAGVGLGRGGDPSGRAAERRGGRRGSRVSEWSAGLSRRRRACPEPAAPQAGRSALCR